MTNFELEQPPIGGAIDYDIMGREDWSPKVTRERQEVNYETLDHITRPQILGFTAIEATNRPAQLQEIIETRGI